MIRIVVVDDHPAMRTGLRTVLDTEPGLVFVGESAGDEESLWPLLHTVDPDVVLLDYHLPHGDGLQLCHRIARAVLAPKVLVHSAYASGALAVPARLAGAHGVVDKGIAARELFEAIRLVCRGERLLPPVSPGLLQELCERVELDDRPILGLLLNDSSEPEAAAALGMDVDDVHAAVRRMLGRLRVAVPAAREM
jgi:DNA-binding NarL/FixJ family response regulator